VWPGYHRLRLAKLLLPMRAGVATTTPHTALALTSGLPSKAADQIPPALLSVRNEREGIMLE
jgi:hypothetical protein